MDEVYKKFGLDENTCDFVGHAMALYRLALYYCSVLMLTLAGRTATAASRA